MLSYPRNSAPGRRVRAKLRRGMKLHSGSCEPPLMADSLFASIIPARSTDYCWLIFNTHAGCCRSCSGRSGRLTVTPALEILNLSGVADPSRLTDFTPVTSFSIRLLLPDQCGRIAYRSLLLVVKKASILALPASDFSVNLV